MNARVYRSADGSWVCVTRHRAAGGASIVRHDTVLAKKAAIDRHDDENAVEAEAVARKLYPAATVEVYRREVV